MALAQRELGQLRAPIDRQVDASTARRKERCLPDTACEAELG